MLNWMAGSTALEVRKLQAKLEEENMSLVKQRAFNKLESTDEGRFTENIKRLQARIDAKIVELAREVFTKDKDAPK